MRVLAIDYGTVRVGLAMSDELKMLATPLKMLRSSRHLAAEISEIVRQNNVDTVLLGVPYLDGEETPTTARVRAFKVKLAAVVGVPIVEWDESFSTRFARTKMYDAGIGSRRRDAKGTVDTWAAALILQEYLDSLDPSRSGYDG